MSVNNNISNQGCISQVQQLNGEVVPLNQQVSQGGEQLNGRLDAIAAQFRKNIPNPEPDIPPQQSKKVVTFLPPPPPKRIPSRHPKSAPSSTPEQQLVLTKALSNQGMYIAAEKAATEGITLEKKIRSPRPMILAELNLFLAASLYEQRKHIEVEKAATDGLNQERKLANPRPSILAGLNYYLDVSLTCQMKSPPPADSISSHQKIMVDATLNLQLAYSRNDRGRHLEAEKAAKEGINEERKSATPRPNVLAELNSELAYSLYVQKEYIEAEKAASDGLNEERKVVTPRQGILENLNKILQKAKEAQNLPMEPSATQVNKAIKKANEPSPRVVEVGHIESSAPPPIPSHQEIGNSPEEKLGLAYLLDRQRKYLEAEKALIEGLNAERKLASPRPSVLAVLNLQLAKSLNEQGRHIEAEKAATDGLNEERKLSTPRPNMLAMLNEIIQKAAHFEPKLVLPAAPAIEEFEKSIELPPLPEVYAGSSPAEDEKRSSSHPSEPMGVYPGSKRRKK